MDQKLEDQAYRKNLIAQIKGDENQHRLQNSQEEWDVYSGNIRPYVERKIINRFSKELLTEVPVVSAINVLKKVVDSRASLYKGEPDRVFTELKEDQEETVLRLYEDMRIDFSMLEANKLYELQKHQTHLLIEPKKGKLLMRPIKAHQVNPVPSELDPEEAEIYIFSAYDKQLNTNAEQVSGQNNYNEHIADYDDYKAEEERYVVWSKNYHFVMDGKGAILTEDVLSPLVDAGVIPVVEIAAMKDFNYWRELTNDVAEFCVDFNVSMSMLGQIVEAQGFAQMYIKGPEKLLPTSIDVGVNRILRLITNPEMAEAGDVEVGYINPNSDIASAQAYNEAVLSLFLSSQGLETTAVSGQATSEKFSSGVERLLSLIEKFEASKETMAIFRDAERDVYKVCKAWHNALIGTDLLDSKYITAELPEDSEVIVKYKEPQSVLSDLDKLEIAERRLGIDWGVAEAKAFLDDMEIGQAEDELKSRPTPDPLRPDTIAALGDEAAPEIVE